MNLPLLYVIAISALLVSDVLLVVIALAVYRRWRAARGVVAEPVPPAADPAIEALRQEVRGIAAALGVLGQRLARIEEGLERQAESASAGGSSTEVERRAYELASKLAARGASLEDLMELCGLPRGEAELLYRVHSGKDAAAG